MKYATLYRKLTTAGAILVLLAAGVAGYALNAGVFDAPVQAQGNQPPETIELFEPFWQAWDLLHENYVDPLDDNALMEGALSGLLEVAGSSHVPADFPSGAADTDDVDALFAPFWDAWTLLHDESSAVLDDNALMEGALSSMMASLGDPHTDYMDPETWDSVNESMSGEYEGIGAIVRQNEDTGGLELVSVMIGSPAEAAGLRPGDQIVRVEGQDITDLTQAEIIALVRGPAGTLVRLGVVRPGADDLLKFEVRRDRISVPTVFSEVLAGNIGYVRLSQFDFGTSGAMRDALEEMDADHLNGLILDVRGNPGGYLTTSIEVASAYLEEGPIVIERSPERAYTHEALQNAIAPNVPMVVLVDQGSASASELIAGALQDRERATIVGMTTFGKGSVQTWRELVNGGGIRITISRWYTPAGRSVSDVGIEPDVVVPYVFDETGGEDNQLAAAVAVLEGTYEAAKAE